MIKKIKNSLTAKIFLITASLLIICCSMTYGFIAWLVPQTYSTELDAALDQRTQAFLQSLESTTRQNSGNLFDQFSARNDVTLLLYNSKDEELDIPSQINVDTSQDESNITETIVTSVEYVNDGTEKTYLFKFAGEDAQYKLIVIGNAQAVNQVIQTIGSIFPLLIIVILIVSMIASFIYSRFVTHPIIKISKVSKQMSEMNLDWQCDETRSDELGILSQSLNTLSQNLSASLSDLKEANTMLQNDIDKEKKLEKARLDFFSAVSHELKTPITVIKGQLEGMLLGVGRYKDKDKFIARSLEVTITLESLVQEILTVSRIEASDFILNCENFDFGEMVKGQFAIFEDIVIQKQLTWQDNIESNVLLSGDKSLLKKVINNLIGNAIHYSPEGNSVFVSIKNIEGKVHFTIENTGIHIPNDDTIKLFEAFYRVEQSRNRQMGGSGLGLYIVKIILDQHKANYKIKNTTQGVEFSVVFS